MTQWGEFLAIAKMQILVTLLALLVTTQAQASLKDAKTILADVHGTELKHLNHQNYDRLVDLLAREVQVIAEQKLSTKEIREIYKFGHPVLNQIVEPNVVKDVVAAMRRSANADPNAQAQLADLFLILKDGRSELKYKINPYTSSVESIPSIVALLLMQVPLWVLGFTNDHTIIGVVAAIWLGVPVTAKLGRLADYLVALARRPKNGTQKVLATLLIKHKTQLSANCERQLTRDNVRE